MRIRGAEGFAFETIAVSGSASSLPHGVPRNVPLERGFLTMDFGAVCDGYRSDMTRTICLGKADAESYDALTEALCNTVSEALGVKKNRIYVKYEEIDNWGWNGMNF